MTATSEAAPSADSSPDPERWIQAGIGWGARAAEWAYLFEPYARPANEMVFDRLDVRPATRLVDIACGSGFAAQLAARRGATVSGLDASVALIDIARARTPDGDLRVGDMFALPFADASFDVATSFNGIWSGCDDALVEARRVLTPDGRLGLTYWGSLDRMGLLPYFRAVIEHSPASHQSATMEQGGTSAVMAGLLESSGFALTEQGTVEVTNEWPDLDTAVRALAAAGPSVPAIEAVGYDAFCDVVRDAMAPSCDTSGSTGLRVTSEFGWVTARPA